MSLKEIWGFMRNLITDFRDKNIIFNLSKLIKKEAKKKINIMEICGGHTHSIIKFGLDEIVGENINFIHGPGCPVCVIPRNRLDEAIFLASQKDTIFCTLADLIRVRASYESLASIRSKGADVRALYSPLDVLKIANDNKDKKVIFFAIGFETTTPMSAVIIQKCLELNIKNLFFHINHVRVPEVVEEILNDKDVLIDAFLGPSHVSVITGEEIYKNIVNTYKKPVAISGFEPVDILEGVLNLIYQINNNKCEIYNEYDRIVKKEGNLKAKELIDKFFKRSDFNFKGVGVVKNSGLELRDEFDFINAKKVFDIKVQSKPENKACACPDILRGKKKPFDCKLFAKICTPNNPMGSCMVSGEGACSAYFKYKKGI